MTERSSAEKQSYLETMYHLGAAVNIITTRGITGDVGFTASAVCGVTDDPPTLLVCMNRNGISRPAFMSSKILCVNVLADEHRELGPVFASVGSLPISDRFELTKWLQLTTSAPVLESAAAPFDCIID